MPPGGANEHSLLSDEHVSKLSQLIEHSDCIVWVGSGLSITAGYPSWKKIIRELCEVCGVTLLSEPEEESADKLIDKAEECKNADINTYHDTLANRFGRQVVSTRFAYQFLMNLPFKAYVTTNFDPLLSEAGAIVGHGKLYSYPIFPREFGNLNPIVYVHGLARSDNQATGENLILARSDFDEAYNDIGIVKNFMFNIFTNYPLLFLGCSLTEPEMYEMFKKVHDIHSRFKRANPDVQLPKRYILLPFHQRIIQSGFHNEKIERDYEKEQNEIKRFEEMKIEVIRYDDRNSHSEIEGILGQICALRKTYRHPKSIMNIGEEVPL